MKLTVEETSKGKKHTRTTEYEGRPELRYRAEHAGWRFIWLYRNKRKQRVATVFLDRCKGDTKPSEAHALLECWPESITIRHAPSSYEKVWIRNENAMLPHIP